MYLWINLLQIVAVILCNTGIALLAYMDGITGSPTLGGVVLATSAAAGSAVYKVKVDVFKSLLFQDFLRVTHVTHFIKYYSNFLSFFFNTIIIYI